MKDAIKVLVLMAGLVLGSGAQAFTIEDDFESGTLNPIWNVAFNGGQPAQVDFVSGVEVNPVIVPTLDGGKAIRVRGEDAVTVSLGTSWTCGDTCELSFATLFHAMDTDPFIDTGKVIAKSATETLELFFADVLQSGVPTWHSFIVSLAPGQWDFSVVHTNGLDTSMSSEMYLDKFQVIGAVAPVPVPGSAWFGVSGIALVAFINRRSTRVTR